MLTRSVDQWCLVHIQPVWCEEQRLTEDPCSISVNTTLLSPTVWTPCSSEHDRLCWNKITHVNASTSSPSRGILSRRIRLSFPTNPPGLRLLYHPDGQTLSRNGMSFTQRPPPLPKIGYPLCPSKFCSVRRRSSPE